MERMVRVKLNGEVVSVLVAPGGRSVLTIDTTPVQRIEVELVEAEIDTFLASLTEQERTNVSTKSLNRQLLMT